MVGFHMSILVHSHSINTFSEYYQNHFSLLQSFLLLFQLLISKSKPINSSKHINFVTKRYEEDYYEIDPNHNNHFMIKAFIRCRSQTSRKGTRQTFVGEYIIKVHAD